MFGSFCEFSQEWKIQLNYNIFYDSDARYTIDENCFFFIYGLTVVYN